MYEPIELLGAVEKTTIKSSELYLMLFFPHIFTFDKKTILLDEIPADTPMALYCAPKVKGRIIEAEGFETRSITPPYVKPKHEVELDRVLKRLPGESQINSNLGPDERYDAVIMDNMAKEEKAIRQLEEYQAVEAVTTGRIVATSDDHPELVIDMGRRSDNHITLIGAAMWKNQDIATYNPDDDIEKWAEESDGAINVIIMDKATYASYRSFKVIQERNKTNSGSNTSLEIGLKDLGAAVSYKGQTGTGIDIIVYSGEYKQEGGSKKDYQPANTLVMGHTSLEGLRLYAVIQDRKAVKEGMHVASRYPRNWEEDGDPSSEYTQTQSAPAMFLPANVVNNFVVVKVND
ncbi:major capsid protein [Vibrio phage ST2-1pr]|uniref:major capsid protein n=1 Tax=Vibrio sp. St2 TaxID=2853441 RepID=UPI001C745662|nr:major capsid protein [Vibrio sp. St2]QXM18751.1 major capsid protein [Vibrio phage ST2-1pr]